MILNFVSSHSWSYAMPHHLCIQEMAWGFHILTICPRNLPLVQYQQPQWYRICVTEVFPENNVRQLIATPPCICKFSSLTFESLQFPKFLRWDFQFSDSIMIDSRIVMGTARVLRNRVNIHHARFEYSRMTYSATKTSGSSGFVGGIAGGA